jgi:hypothetical protein
MPLKGSFAMNKSQASQAGFHMLNAYQCCAWAWYLRYVLGLEASHKSKFLSFGTAMHAAMQAYYEALRDGTLLDQGDFVSAGLTSLAEAKSAYAKPDDFDADRERLPRMLTTWYGEWAQRDAEDFDVLAVEEEIVFALPFDLRMTVRPDVVLRDRLTKGIFALEHKSTSKGVAAMAHSVAMSLQVDAQLLGLRSHFDLADSRLAIGIVPNILYQRQSVVKAERPAPLSRSPRELAESALNFAGLFRELGAKCERLETSSIFAENLPESQFPRNGAWCGQMNCEYEAICRSRLKPGEVPIGFTHVEADADADADAE